MMKLIIAWLQLWSRKKTYRIAVKKANEINAETGAVVFVILYNGEFIAVTKRRLKNMRKQKLISTDAIDNIAKHAVYTAK